MKIEKCPFCGGEAILESSKLRYGTIYSSYCQKCGAEITGFSEREAVAAWNRRAQPANARPPCYLPEKDNPYPLCIGRGMTVCAHCCLWADYDQDENESRVNHPLTLEELRGMVGEWVWVEHMDSPASQAAPGEWLKLKTCEPTRLDPHIRFEGKGLCALYYGQSWLAYRYKPEDEV